MNNKVTALAAISILLAVAITPINFTQTADALQASGIKNSQYGMATKNKVCGDKLCSEISPEERQIIKQKMVSNNTTVQTTLDEIMDKMDKIHEKHQTQMMQMWQTMTSQEQEQMIERMSQMVEQMQTMSMEQHMSMMMGDKQHDQMMMTKEPLYNETLNPRQIEYPNIVGFNDLHIHANRHLDPERSLGPVDHLLQTIVHHHCKVYDDMTASCLLFPYGMTDQDKPYGIEYVITVEQFNELPDEEKHYWHYHKTEFPRADATFPDLTDAEVESILPILNETYGKVFYFWSYGDTYPIGEPYILVVQDLPDH